MSLNFFAKLCLSIVVGKKWQRDLFRQMLTDFIDTEHELVLPQLTGLKWSTERCQTNITVNEAVLQPLFACLQYL